MNTAIRRISIIFCGSAILIVCFCALYYHGKSQSIINLFINRHFISEIPFLEPDYTLGWRNKPGFSDLWPKEHPDLVIKYSIDPYGRRALSNSANQESDGLGDSAIKDQVWIIGDSSAFGLGVSFKGSLAAILDPDLNSAGLVVKNFSVVGYGSMQIRKRFYQLLAENKENPKIVIIWVGYNDTEYSRSLFWKLPFYKTLALYNFKNNITKIVKQCIANNSFIIVVTLPSFNNYEQLITINTWIRSLQLSPTQGKIVDLELLFSQHGNTRELYSPLDRLIKIIIHPSESGHSISANALKASIYEWLELNRK